MFTFSDIYLKCIKDKKSKSASSSQDLSFSKLVSNVAKSIYVFHEFFQKKMNNSRFNTILLYLKRVYRRAQSWQHAAKLEFLS